MRIALLSTTISVACTNPSILDEPAPPRSPPLTDRAIAIDAVADEPAWIGRALRAELPGSPWTEIRLLRDERDVFVFVEARDRDVGKSDTVTLAIGALVIQASTTDRAVPDGVRIAREIDGTIDLAFDEDVGWRVELAIPKSLLREPVVIDAQRCSPTCVHWATTLYP